MVGMGNLEKLLRGGGQSCRAVKKQAGGRQPWHSAIFGQNIFNFSLRPCKRNFSKRRSGGPWPLQKCYCSLFHVSPGLGARQLWATQNALRCQDSLHTGIIGFTQAGMGVPASDFAPLLGPRGYGKNFVQRFESVYPELPTLQERIQFYVHACVLQEAFS